MARRLAHRTVAQASEPAVSPTSKSASAGPRTARGLETRDTAGLEACATPSDTLPLPSRTGCRWSDARGSRRCRTPNASSARIFGLRLC
jgi:hypothetical protein